jgi:diphthamide biosynthesis protein 3
MADDGEEPISVYDEVEIEDMTFDSDLQIYHYPCPCGDRFEIALLDLKDGEEIAVCPSCSLMIRVVFEVVSCPHPPGCDDSHCSRKGSADRSSHAG